MASRNTAPHQKCSSTKPPASGPTALPAENAETQMAMARERCAGSSNMLNSSDSVEGASVAPATPSSARLRMSISALVLNAHSRLATPNAAAPMSSSRRRPMRSPRVPMVMSKPATMKP